MDFERASIKALFYDYPVETVVKAIEDARRNKDGYIDILPQLVRWREDAFTTTEARLMENLAQDVWAKLDEKNAIEGYIDEPDAINIPFIYRPFLFVKYMAEKMLTQDPKTLQPQVIFEELLRWKDITLFLGEDLFTTAYLAYKDISASPARLTKVFDWPDYIENNNKELNDILKQGISENHSHYNASADVFSLNWITMTNSLTQLDKHVKEIKMDQDVTLSTTGTEQLYSYKRMCIAAAYLRLQFFKALNDEEYSKLCRVKSILEDDFTASQERANLCAEIGVLRTKALKGSGGRVLDYAIRPNIDVKQRATNASLLFYGERQLMYRFFTRFFLFDIWAWSVAPCFYLYLVLKTRIRKEFVQINQLKGFENFETYQDRKDLFVEKDAPLANLFDPIVLQTTIRHRRDHLEGRVTPKYLVEMNEHGRLRARNYTKGVYAPEAIGIKPEEQISLVVHFIKANYSKSQKAHDLYLSNRQDYPRFDQYRKKIKGEINQVLKIHEQQKKRPNDIQIVGIDAASTEMFCRPEVFGHIFRYARKKGLSNQTYHVGEDFFDIVDGLRAIDEAMLFLELNGARNRIGHALAMGIEADMYYTKRRFNILAPKQYVLDNCVWICIKASKYNIDMPNSLETELMNRAKQLYKEIGYDCYKPFDLYTYWNSMLLRGDEPCDMREKRETMTYWESTFATDWQQTAEVKNKDVDIARQDMDACYLYYLYNYCHKIKANGEKRYHDKYQTKEIIKVVETLQEEMRIEVAHRGIAVECNPTSNLKIGFVDKYCEHPLLTKFDPIEYQSDPHYPLLNASVNTDDRGVFATTLYNEFSLLAAGMIKEKKDNGDPKYGTRQVMDYIDHLRQAGEKQRFRV